MKRNDKDTLQRTNTLFWEGNNDEILHPIVLPSYGCHTLTEDELHLFGDVAGKKLLDIGCGNGESLCYHGSRHAAELWGMDISRSQLAKAEKCLAESGYLPSSRLICAAMEEDCGLPTAYFDYVYSIYAIGWTTDLQGTFNRIASYLKKGGIFIFSWSHHMHKCVDFENDRAYVKNSYFDESWHEEILDGKCISLCSRKPSTYINALARAGFAVEEMVEQTDDETLHMAGTDDEWIKRAQMIPLTYIFKARKL